MKRFVALLLAMLLCVSCVLAEEIGELGPATVQAPTDPNEIGELIVATPAPVANDGIIEDAVPTAPADNMIEDATPAVMGGVIEDNTPAEPIEKVAEPLTASGETVTMKNVVLAVPAGWSVVSNTDDTASGGAIMLQMGANDGSNQMLQAQSQSIGTEENVKMIISSLGEEAFLSQTLIGTMQGFGVVIEEYEFAHFIGDLPCVRASENVNLGGVEYTMSMAVMLDGTHMVVIMLMLEGSDAAADMEALNVFMSPMMAQ